MRPLATVTVTPPVLDTWYEVLPPTSDVRMLYFSITQTNTAALMEELAFRIVADGHLYIQSGNVGCVSGTRRYLYLRPSADVLHYSAADIPTMTKLEVPWEARTISCYTRQRVRVSAGASLRGDVRYQQL